MVILRVIQPLPKHISGRKRRNIARTMRRIK